MTRSVLASELHAVSNSFDVGVAIAHTYGILLGVTVWINVYTDSRTLIDAFVTLCCMTEKCLLIDIAGLREPCRRGDIAGFSWIRSRYNLADPLTKYSNDSVLHQVLETRTICMTVEQWIEEVSLETM